MHEFSIIENIFKTITEVAGKEKLNRVTRINLVIGKMRQIVPDIFEYAFHISSKNTIAENAKLSIEFVPIKMKCNDCNHISEIADHIYFCSSCGSSNLELLSGKELYIKSIEFDC